MVRTRRACAGAVLLGLLGACSSEEGRQRLALEELGWRADGVVLPEPELEAELAAEVDPARVGAAVVRKNPDALAALERWVARLERAPQVRSLPDPWLRYRYSSMFAMHTVELMQEIPWPEKLLADARAALAEARVAEAEAARVRDLLRERAVSATAGLFVARRALELLEQNLAELERFVAVARARYEAGTAQQSDLLRAELERDGMRVAREGAARDALLAASALNALLDRRPDAALGPVTLALPAASGALAELLQRAQASNPELSVSRARLEYEREMVGHADLSWLPDLALGGAYVRDMRMDEDELELTAGLSLPVWGWKNQAHRREAQAGSRRAEAELRAARNRVLDEVVQAAGRLDAALAQERILREQALPTAERNVGVTEAAYVAGRVDLLAWIDANRQLLAQRLELARLQGEAVGAGAALRRAVGGDETGGAR